MPGEWQDIIWLDAGSGATQNVTWVKSVPATINLVVDGQSGNKELEGAIALVFQEYFELWKTKQRKYGPNNIAALGRPGLVIRMNDKIQRLRRFNFEAIEADAEGGEEDAWLDALGYAAMGVMVLRGQWPKCEAGKVTIKNVWAIFKLYLQGGR